MPQVSLHSLLISLPPPPPPPSLSLSVCLCLSVSLSLSARSEVPQVSLHSLSLSLPPLSLSLSVCLCLSLSRLEVKCSQVSLHSLSRCPLSLSLSLSFSVSTLSMIFLSTSHAGWIPLTAAWLFQDSSVYHHEVEDWRRSRNIPCLRTDRCNMFWIGRSVAFWDLDK